MKNKKNYLSILIILVIILLIIDPKNNIDSCLNGIKLWATAVLPSLLPFFFLTSLLLSLGFVQKIGKFFAPITTRIFKTDGISGYIYAMSVISGYPVGAKTTAELYENGIISRGQAHKITTFTSTSGPLFIIGTVGIGMFGSAKLGYLILLCHIIGAGINGLIYRNTFLDDYPSHIVAFSKQNSLEDNMYNSIKSVLVVGGYIALFYMLISMLNNYNILYPFCKFLSLVLRCDISICNSIVNGLIEMTRGCLDLSKLILTDKQTLVIATGLISFGGMSIFVQALTFLSKFKISLRFYFLSKVTQTIISTILALIIGTIFL